MWKRLSATAIALVALCAAFAHAPSAGAASVPQFPPCHNDSTQVKQTSDKGGPALLGPGSENGLQAYYYVTETAGCGSDQPGSTVTLAMVVDLTDVLKGTVDSDGMCWGLELHQGYDKTPVAAAVEMGNTVHLTYDNAIAGQQYRFRIANLETGLTIQDHSSVDG